MDPNDEDFDKAQQLRGEITCGSGSDEEDYDQKRECSDNNFHILMEGGIVGELQGGNCVVDGELWAENCDCTDPENYNYLDAGWF